MWSRWEGGPDTLTWEDAEIELQGEQTPAPPGGRWNPRGQQRPPGDPGIWQRARGCRQKGHTDLLKGVQVLDTV